MHRLHDQILCIAAQVVGTFASKIDLEALLITVSNLRSQDVVHLERQAKRVKAWS